MAITTLIVDDEQAARDIVREYLREDERFAIVGECANGFEAVKAANETRPQLIFLDIQMPKLDGFEVVDLLDTRPAIVFVTAYDEHAVRAFEVHAMDYLLKPFSKDRFETVLDRAASLLDRNEAQPLHAVATTVREKNKGALQRVVIRLGSDIEVIPVTRIDYVEASDDYVTIATAGRKLLKQQTIGELESQLDPRRFVRIHRSCIINIDRLARVEPYAKDSRVAILHDGTRLPISRSGYARLREML
jgi:two-component system LytT family response regulator